MTNIGLKTMDSFVKGYAHFTQGLRKVCELGLVIMTVTITYHLVLRYLFNNPTSWVIEINGYILVFISLFGMVEVLREKRMIKLDLFLNKVSPTVKLKMEIFYLLIMLVFCIIVALKGFEMAANAYRFKLFRESILHTPLYIPYLIPPISLCLMIPQILIEIRENVKKIVYSKNSKVVLL